MPQACRVTGYSRGRERWFMRYASASSGVTLRWRSSIPAGFSPVLSPMIGAWSRTAIYTASYSPILALAVASGILARARWRSLCMIYLLATSFVIVAVTVHAHTSQRSYLDVYLAILASYAICSAPGVEANMRKPNYMLRASHQ